MTYTHVIKAWREGTAYDRRLPIACNSEESARAMFAEVLRSDSEFDHADLFEQRAHGLRWIESGHRESSALTRMTAGTVNHALEPMVDHCYASMMAANSADPYVHEEYARWDEMLIAALVLLTNGDMPYARALRWAFTDSGENVRHYLTFSRNDLCLDAGEMTREEYDATLRWAVECEEDGETWTDAFATQKQAEDYAAELVANTTVVDREAATTNAGGNDAGRG